MEGMIGNDILLSLEQVISSAKSMLRVDNTQEHDDDMEYWANEGVNSLGDMSSVLIKNNKFDIVDGKICLPRGFIYLLGIGWAVDDDNPYKFTWNYYNVGHNAQTDQFYIQNGYLVFDRPERLENIHHCQLLYQTKNLDCSGLYYLTQDQERAIRSYICWKFAQKFYDKVPRDMRNEWMREWTAQANKCRSLTARNNFEQNRAKINAIANLWANQRYTWWGYFYNGYGYGINGIGGGVSAGV